MKRVAIIIMCLILSAVPVHADAADEHQAVEAMRKVWNIEEGGITEDANWNTLADALKLAKKLENDEMRADLFKMAVAARRAIWAEEKAEEERKEAERKADEERRQLMASARYYGNCRITFYCPCSACCGSWGNATASGVAPTAGRTVANGSLPFGTRVLIDGQEYVVEDRGVGSDQFDIFVSSHSEALARGLYYTEVKIIG